MDMALTLVSIASFFGLILAWIVVPSQAVTATEPAPPLVTSPQVATN